MNRITRTVIRIFCICSLVLSTPLIATELRDITGDGNAPPLELADLDGRQHSLDDYAGKVLLVNFWASWCHPCLQEIPELINLGKRMADRPFAIIAVNVGEEKRKLPIFTKKMAEHMVMLMDPDSIAFEEWEGIGLPSSFVLDLSGRIRHEAYGPVNWDADYIIESFEQLMAENPAAVENSKPTE
jgi:thiol-disulfide isomerase/thioredoxin